ncbi:MAG: hypothetical protein NZ846_08955 [Thermus sp.]|jgi:hypothetical protein|uniref:hypothetical protein n=1 Tax=Thermus sp. TaxID=275 RepID=UPI0025D6358C|nr:hypothetical protein [Thermus sp.]MCS6868765.1 hypothetical protein [Thermus sp.]MCS7219085.1 hypothetical protein [Thermus sp.]MCX7850580.1 hypothetical protein [Thermus sp.]MDW8357846.1 hypothetical protein [Thermus sp.]
MNAKAILQMAERLAQKGDTGALKLLVRQASLPLLAEAMLGWTIGRFQSSPAQKGRCNEEVPHAVLGSLAKPIPEVNHALLLALGEVLHRHGICL